jgi:lipid-binding SYLF domain-containing protein
VALSTGFVLLAVGCTSPQGATVQEKHQVVQNMKTKTLNEIYAKRPEVQTEVTNAPGYAVFSKIETKILFAGTGSGYGVHVNNLTGKQTYMKMAKIHGGFGVGLEDLRVLLVFPTRDVMERFVSQGWEFGVGASLGAQSGDRGASGTAQGSLQEIRIYQITDAGVVAGATLAGTKYWPNADLN